MVVTTTNRVASTKIYLEPGDATTCLAGSGGVTYGAFVKAAAAGLGNHPVVVLAGAGDTVYGVAHHTAAATEEVSVLRQGTIGVMCGVGNLTSGDEVSVGVNGTAVKATAGSQTGSGSFVVTAPTRRVGVCTADTTATNLAPVTLYNKPQ